MLYIELLPKRFRSIRQLFKIADITDESLTIPAVQLLNVEFIMTGNSEDVLAIRISAAPPKALSCLPISPYSKLAVIAALP